MPLISEVTDVMTAPMDESNTSNSYQISSSTPEQVQTHSRAMHVRKSNSKSSHSRSSSSSSSRPPVPKSALPSHRGPGSLASNQSGAITPIGSRHGTPEPSVVGVSQAYGLSLNDQRSLQQSSTTNVMYDQRSLRQQVNVGMDPNVAASAIAHAYAVESQATQRVDEIQREASQYTQQVEQQALQHVQGIEAQAQNAVEAADSHAKGVEIRANQLLEQMRDAHKRELSEVQTVANQAYQNSQQQLHTMMAENSVLNERLESQSKLLETQQSQQQELLTTVRKLQSELTSLKHQNVASDPVVLDNGAGIQDIQMQMLQMMQDLSQEVQVLKQDRQTDVLRAQLHKQGNTPSPIAPSPVWSGSACAGIPDNFNIATPSMKFTRDKIREPSSSSGHASHPSIPLKPPREPSSPGSSASSSTSVGNRGGGGGGSSGSPGASGFQGGSLSSSLHRSAGVGSGRVELTEKEIYKSKDLSLVKIEQLPVNAAQFRSWKNAFITKTCAIDQTGEDVILSWIAESFNVEDGDQLHNSGILPRLDAHLASLLADTRHLKSEIGMSYQSYIEKCQMAGRSPKGRFMIWLLAQQFRLDMQRGANLTEQSLLELECESFTYNGLKAFIEKIEFVLNAIPFEHQPSERTKFTWLFGRVKKCRMIQRHIDRVKDASPDSHRRSFDWLFDKLKTALWEIREDQNEESIRAALQPKGKPQPPPKSALAASTDSKGDKSGGGKGTNKEEETKGLPGNAVPKVKPKAKAKADGAKGANSEKGKGKGKGKGDKEKKEDKDKPKAPPKATVECLFFPKGTCSRGDSCPFVHNPAKAAAKAKPAATAKPAAVAFVVGSAGITGASASNTNTADENLKKSAWSVFKSSIAALVKPFVTLMSLASSCFDSSACLEPQGFASIASLCSSNGGDVKDIVPQIPDDVSVKDALHCVPAVLSYHHALSARSARTGVQPIEWIADSGAGRDLCSERAFLEQGFTKSMIDQYSTAVNPTKFETGNGTFVSDSCISLDGSSFGKASYHVMNDCPLVRALGKIVQDDGKPFVWIPGELPFFGKSKDVVQVAADESQIIQADRVEDGVPIFVEDVDVSCRTYALAAGDGEVVVEDPAPPPVAPPVEGGEHLSDADSEDGDEEPLPRAQRLQAEARSIQHRMCHIPKNPYCDICRRSRMYRRKVTRKRHDPLEARGELEEVTKFGQRLALDFIVVNKSHANDKEAVVLVIRDEYSGYLAAYPCAKRNSDNIVRSTLSFLGPSFHEHPTIMCKTDNAPEFMSACTTLGFVHEPTLARRWPHNSVVEREVRTLEETTRAAHLGAGFHMLLDLWQHSVQYAATVINAYHPIKDGDGNLHNRHELASGKPFEGRQLILGQLVYVRKDPLNRHKFEANAVPALFVGWRYDSGPKSHKGVYLTIDYAAVKSQKSGYSVATSVPCEEVYVPPGDPILPLHAAAETALADFSEPNMIEYLPKDVPFSSLPLDASSAVRHEYITLDRIIRFGASPDCKACSELKGRHNSRCKARFDMLVKAEKAAKIDKPPEPPVEGSSHAKHKTANETGTTSVEDKTDDIPVETEIDESAVHPDDLPFSAGIPPAAVGKTVELSKQFLEIASMRSRYRRLHHLPGQNVLFEFACSDDSILGQVSESYSIKCIRLSRSTIDLCDASQLEQALGQVEQLPGADTWVSVVCTYHSQLQHLNKSIHGPAYQDKLRKNQKQSVKLLRSAEMFIDKVLSLGGRAAFELPAENELWNDEQFKRFEESHGMCRVYFHGCAFNLRGRQGGLIKKPCAVSTTDLRLIQHLDQHRCDGSHEHEHAMGGNAAKTAFYTREMAETIIESLYPKKFYHNVTSMTSKAVVTRNMKKSEWINNPEAVESVKKEAIGLRNNRTWDDSSVTTLANLKMQKRFQGTR